MRKLFLFILLVLIGAGIALQTGLARPVVKWQVESALTQSGLSENRADCMAGRMVDRLSVWQLWKLRQGMAAREGEPEEASGLGDLIKRLRRVGDFEVASVVTTSAGLCAIGIG